MTFSKALFHYTKTNGSLTYDIAFGTPSGSAAPYFVMLTLPGDLEQPGTLCQTQGEAGETVIQYSVTGTSGSGEASDLLEELHAYISDLLGNISYNGTTYNIWDNKTGGISPIAGGDSNTWDAIFETTFRWEKL